MTGWGQDGPLAPRAGHDIGYIAVTGALGMIGDADGPPAVPANLLGDYAGGSLYLVVGVLAALHHARATGTGQVVDAAIVDGTAHLTSMIHGMLAAGAWQDRRGANLLDGGSPFYGTYATADGGHMAVGAVEERFYAEFTRLLGLGDDAPDRADPERGDDLRAAVGARFLTRTRAEWTRIFDGSDACVAPVLSLGEAPHHPHLAARGTFVDHEGIVQPAPAPRFSRTPATVRHGPSRPGADTAAVARDWDLPGLTDGGAAGRPAPAR
jgi:alpha-methylacyl-CoA racemase